MSGAVIYLYSIRGMAILPNRQLTTDERRSIVDYKPRVLFFSTSDSTRDQMPEGFLRKFAGRNSQWLASCKISRLGPAGSRSYEGNRG